MTLAGESEEPQRPLAAGPEPVGVCPTTDQQPRGPSRAEDDLQHLGTEAIEQLACGLNKAAITIQEFGHNASDEERLKQLNDEQLLKLLEEAYHSKKLDDKNKSAFFKEILEDVHDSISSKPVTSTSAMSSKQKASGKETPSSSGNSPKKLKGCPSPTSVVTIPAPSSRGHHRRGLSNDDSSSTKTEIEEMDQFSDLEDNAGGAAGDGQGATGEDKKASKAPKSLDENGNPVGSLNYANRQLRPLSIYRHNPAFHSQHVSVNQSEGSPPPLHHHHHHHHSHASPSQQQRDATLDSDEPATLVTPDSASLSSSLSSSRFVASKSRKKKKAVPKDTVNAEEIDGYRGDDDLDRILEFIEAKPDKSEDDKSTVATPSSKNVAKRNRRPNDRKAKRSRTPSAAPSLTKETSQERHPKETTNGDNNDVTPNGTPADTPRPEPNPPESVTTGPVVIATKPPKPVKASKPSQILGTLISSYITSSSTSQKANNKANSKQTSPASQMPKASQLHRNESPKTSQSRSCDRKSSDRKSSSVTTDEIEILHGSNPSTDQEEFDNFSVHESKMCYDDNDEDDSAIINPSENENQVPNVDNVENDVNDSDEIMVDKMNVDKNNSSNSVPESEAVCQQQQQQQPTSKVEETQQPSFNYESILKFVKNEWDIVTLEISNGSSDIQSKIVYYKSREQYTN